MSKIADVIIERIQKSGEEYFTKEMIIAIIDEVKGGNQIVKSGDITLDLSKSTIQIGDSAPEKMQNMMFKVLAYLIDKEGLHVKRSELLRNIWGDDVIVGDKTVDVTVHKIRGAIGRHRIVMERNVGYLFIPQN
jgi:two-component system alkaline phosphatase synthesis response regulator PhoP